MRSVLGPVPPPLQRPSAPRLPRRQPRPRWRPRRGTKLSWRAFALAGFVAWGALLVFFDWGLGSLRRPGDLTEKVGKADGPPAVMFPEPADEPAETNRKAHSRGGDVPITAVLRRVRGGAVETSGPAAGLGELIVPVSGVSREDLRDQFEEPRGGGRRHEAIDILAKRNTPVVAAADGTVDKLFTSKAGGLTIYQRDAGGAYQLYYAHLESYAPGLREGDTVQQGQVIGYVGTSGNAPRDVPHLHFAVFRMGPERRWWEGDAVNPYSILARDPVALSR